MKRKITALLLAVIMCVSLFPITAKAAIHTQAETLAWVQSKLGHALDMDGVYGAQCVDLILAYYDYMGVPRSSGDAKDYATNALPSGWQRLPGAVPQPGDVLIYGASAKNPYGHVAIYESDWVTYHQNFNNQQYVQKVTSVKYNGFTNPYWGVIRPDFHTVTEVSVTWDVIENTPYDTNFFTKVRANANIGGTWSETGITVYDKNYNIVASKGEYPTYHTSYMEVWYDITNELGVTLQKGTPYIFQYYAIFNGDIYYSPVYTITTTGAIPKPTVDRISGTNRSATALAAAEKLKTSLGVSKHKNIIIASGKNFADALAGSYLASVKQAPILLHTNSSVTDNLNYIANNLTAGGTVYILGGTAAVPFSVEAGLFARGINVERLSGSNRFATNIEILLEAGVTSSQEILVCTGQNFADSLSASATGLPILLVNSKTNTLTDNQKIFLKMWGGSKMTIIGGDAAVSNTLKNMLSEYGNVNRIYGKNRYETSTLIANNYFRNPASICIAYGKNFPDGLCGGPLAFANKSPLVLTNAGSESYAANYVSANTTIKNAYVLGGTAAISDSTIGKIF